MCCQRGFLFGSRLQFYLYILVLASPSCRQLKTHFATLSCFWAAMRVKMVNDDHAPLVQLNAFLVVCEMRQCGLSITSLL